MNPELREGDTGEWVEYLQQLLEYNGFPPGRQDGQFDSGTAAALRACQESRGLDVTGIADQPTWVALDGAGADESSSSDDADQASGEGNMSMATTDVQSAEDLTDQVSGEPNMSEPMNVQQSITLVPQPTEQSCWAASMAMLLDMDVDDVVAAAGMTTTDSYGWSEIQNAVSIHGLTEIGPACGGPDYFAPMLEQSALWIVEVGAPYHAVVLAGLSGGGEWDNTEATIYNPWPPGTGAIEQKPFMDFANEYELGSGAMAQIVSR
jgi:hypothetical protein